MKKIQLYLLGMLLLCGLSTQAQKEAYNWFYGSGQGITWNQTQTFNGIPINAPNTTVPLTGIPTRYDPVTVRPQMYPMSTREGVFSMSDGNGKLLFYSSGSTIYNANHVIMRNATGLEGNYSSAQSGIVLPFPRNRNKHLVISIGTSQTRGFAYSVIDMAGDGGLGELAEKNRPFTLPSGSLKWNFVESVMATKHANGVDYWVVAIERTGTAGTSKMVAWLVTQDGVSNTPVASIIPTVLMGPNHSAYGYLKMSPNGKYFALMMHEKNDFMWGEFNNRTGVFANIQSYTALTRNVIPTYGAEFSPNGKYLYVSSGLISRVLVSVFDFEKLLRGDGTIIQSFESASNGYYAAAMQLGPDLRMYMTMSPPIVASPSPSILYMLDQPNEPLSTGMYMLKDLSPGYGKGDDGASGTRFGLPTFASSFFVDVEGTATLCVGEEAVYTINTNASRLEVDFDEGDGPIAINSSEELRHSFKKPGNYLIKIRPLNGQGQPIQEEIKTVYTIVYSCYLPVNHNLRNAEY